MDLSSWISVIVSVLGIAGLILRLFLKRADNAEIERDVSEKIRKDLAESIKLNNKANERNEKVLSEIYRGLSDKHASELLSNQIEHPKLPGAKSSEDGKG